MATKIFLLMAIAFVVSAGAADDWLYWHDSTNPIKVRFEFPEVQPIDPPTLSLELDELNATEANSLDKLAEDPWWMQSFNMIMIILFTILCLHIVCKTVLESKKKDNDRPANM